MAVAPTSGTQSWRRKLKNPLQTILETNLPLARLFLKTKKSSEVSSCLSLAGLGAGSNQFRTREIDFVLCLWREEMVACARVPAPPLSSWVPPQSAPAFLLCLRAIA